MKHQEADIKDILALFDHFDAMQQKHLEALQISNDANVDFARQRFERSQLFQDLKNLLNRMQQTTLNAPPLAGVCSERLTTLQHRSQMIMKILEDHRSAMISQKRQLRNGKRALNSYAASPASGSPRFISKTG